MDLYVDDKLMNVMIGLTLATKITYYDDMILIIIMLRARQCNSHVHSQLGHQNLPPSFS